MPRCMYCTSLYCSIVVIIHQSSQSSYGRVIECRSLGAVSFVALTQALERSRCTGLAHGYSTETIKYHLTLAFRYWRAAGILDLWGLMWQYYISFVDILRLRGEVVIIGSVVGNWKSNNGGFRKDYYPAFKAGRLYRASRGEWWWKLYCSVNRPSPLHCPNPHHSSFSPKQQRRRDDG